MMRLVDLTRVDLRVDYPRMFATPEGSERVAQAFEAAAERMEKEASDG